MKAMILPQITDLTTNKMPLKLVNMSKPAPGEGEVLIKVSACGVCHTELDEIEGRTPPTQFPIILGHEVIGKVVEKGPHSKVLQIGDRVGIGWIHSACGVCQYCRSRQENVCEVFEATGRDVHGGYAEYTVVKEDFARVSSNESESSFRD